MKRARQYLSGFKRSFTRLLLRPNLERPDFHRLALLTQFSAVTGCNELESAAVAYFSKTLSTAGFLSTEEVPQVVANYSEYKATWRRAMLREADRNCHIGLPVYASQTGPLEGGLDWSTLPARRDRLYQLRPHRFGFLPRLAIAATCGADTLPALLATLEGWIAQIDRHGAEDPYFSNLIVIYRLLAVSWTVPFCAAMARSGDHNAAATCLRLFQILAADIRYLRPRLGASVANNHLLADRFAAWFLATCHPDIYGRAGTEGLERSWLEELCRQFQADGTNFEQSTHYHELGCELAVAYLLVSLRSGKQLQEPILSLIRAMLRFQAALTDDRGNTFALGDATEDPLLPLDSEAGWGGGAWRVLYKSLFDGSFPATADTARGSERAFWLLAGMAHIAKPLRVSEKSAPIGSLVAFADGGYVAFRDDRPEQIVLFRTGPRHDVQISPGHAMSDLLSVYWNLAGQPVMEPSGTYSYATQAELGERPKFPRDYFRSPAASNGLVLNGHDPLDRPKGRFRESDNGTRVAMQSRSLDRSLDWAEGRLDEGGPLNGYRRGVLHVGGWYSLVYDRLPPLAENAEVSCYWQFSPEAKVAIRGSGQVSVDISGHSAFICCGGDLDLRCLQGQSDPPAGWVSRSYGKLQAAPQLIAALGPRAQDFAFVFGVLEDGQELPFVEVRPAGRNGLLLEVRRDNHRSIACVGDVSVSSGALPFDFDFRGDVLWLNIENAICREIRALGLKSVRSPGLGLELNSRTLVGPRDGTWRMLEQQVETDGMSGRWGCRIDG